MTFFFPWRERDAALRDEFVNAMLVSCTVSYGVDHRDPPLIVFQQFLYLANFVENVAQTCGSLSTLCCGHL